jgi:hypothetical protein
MKEDLKMVLQNKASEISEAAEAVMAHTRDWQMIQNFMSNRLQEFQLTATQQMKMERYQFIYNAMVSGKYTDKEVLAQVKTNFGVKQAQAYQDMAATQEIFSTVVNINKRFELSLMLQLNKNYQRRCLELNDMKSLAKFEKNRIDITKQLEDLEDDRGELFEGHTFEMTFDPTLLGAKPITKNDLKELLNSINSRRQKKIKTDMFDELDYEEEIPPQ